MRRGFHQLTTHIRAARKSVKGLTLNPLQMFYGIEDVSLGP